MDDFTKFLLELLARTRHLVYDLNDPHQHYSQRLPKINADLTDLYSLLATSYWETVYKHGTDPEWLRSAHAAFDEATAYMVARDQRERCNRRYGPSGCGPHDDVQDG
jgi:hypothetical protein